MEPETKIIETIEMELWNEQYEITKREVMARNNHRVEKVFIRKIGK